MDITISLDRTQTRVAAAAARARMPDDVQMLRLAAELTRNISAARPIIYWSDFLGSAVTGYTGLLGAVTLAGPWAVIAGLVAIVALYRAMSFIHEVTHVKHATLPGFRLGYNLAIGIPLLIPSFMYEGVHNLHHTRTRYGTAEDPEYLPLALMKPWTLPVFILVAAFAPIGLLFRFAVLTPLSLLNGRLRAVVVGRFSGLQINPAFRRRSAEGDAAKFWQWQEASASIWAILLLGMVATGVLNVGDFAIIIGVASGVAMLNQTRTLVAHLWENEGEPMTVTAQYLDSVNVPPPTLLPALWAPVGLRYHALHHLLPSLPYHSLGEAHRRLTKALDAQSPYHKGQYPGLRHLISRIVASTSKL
jgi:fatty acid desaturase